MIDSIYPILAFADNYIWAISAAADNRLCVVDPGDANPVIEYAEANNRIITDIFVTHHHPDHTGGLARLIEKYTPRIIGPAGSNIKGITQFVAEGDQVNLFDLDFTIMEVPGHTLDHIAFYQAGNDKTAPILFCGDTLFAAGCGRLFEGTPAQMQISLTKLKSLPETTRVYCTHEYTLSNLRFAQAADPTNNKLLERIKIETLKRQSHQPTLPSSIKLEIETNPFLRCTEPNLIESAAAQLERNPTTEVEVFAALRSWKDRF